jgi:hypothetical protein
LVLTLSAAVPDVTEIQDTSRKAALFDYGVEGLR